MFGRNTTAAILTASLASVTLLAGCRGEATTGASDLDPATFASNLRLVAGGQQTGAVALNLPQALTVRVVDAGGQPVTGAEVNWAVMSGGGTVNPPIGSSNAEGLVSTTWTLGTTLGEHRVRAYLRRGFLLDSTDFVATATPGAATVVVLDSSVALPASAVVATTITGVRFVVRDQFGYPVQGDTVEFLPSAGATVSPLRAVSDAQGVVATSWTLPQLVGAPTISARLVRSGIQTSAVSLQTTPDASRVLTISDTDLGSGMAGTTLAEPILAQVSDRFGNAIVGEPVNFADSLPTGVVVTPASGVTNAGGQASATVRLSEELGPVQVRVRIAAGDPQSQVGRVTAQSTMTFRDVYAGNYYACGVGTNDRAYCWGFGQDGQLGTGQAVSLPGPRVAVPAPAGGFLTVREISGGDSHTCALSIARSVYCWGANPDARQMGATGPSLVPQLITTTEALGSVRTITTGESFSCAITMGGNPLCYGLAERGQLGGGPTQGSNGMPQLWSHIVAGERHGCGAPRASMSFSADTAGRIWCWGANDNGQLGVGDLVDRATPDSVRRPTTLLRFDTTSVVAGGAHTCALEDGAAGTDRPAWCWGANGFGQLGKGVVGGRDSVPQPVGASFVRLYAGEFHTCGLTADGSALCWGRNNSGQLGTGNTSNVSVPTLAASTLRFRNLALGENFTCGIAASGVPSQVGTTGSAGVIHCWGDNEYGQVGTGTFGTNAALELSPRRVIGQ